MNRALKTPWSGLGLALTGVLALPISTAFAIDRPMANNPMPDYGTAQLLARGGGGGSFGGGSGRRAGGNSGFSSAGAGLNRGSSRPTGGWSNNARVGAGAGGPSLNRPATPNRPAAGTRQLPGAGQGGGRIANRDLNRDGNRDVNRDVNRNVSRNVNRNIVRRQSQLEPKPQYQQCECTSRLGKARMGCGTPLELRLVWRLVHPNLGMVGR